MSHVSLSKVKEEVFTVHDFLHRNETVSTVTDLKYANYFQGAKTLRNPTKICENV